MANVKKHLHHLWMDCILAQDLCIEILDHETERHQKDEARHCVG